MIPDLNLIFDVGANDGTDTDYYLSKGYRVVAVEADPALAKRLGERYIAETGDGRVVVANAAVMEKDREKVDFFVSKEDIRSSLIRSMAERPGQMAGIVEIAGRSLCSLFAEYGLPWYCKIDIEGYDAIAVSGMGMCEGRPAFISCESTGHSIEAIDRDNGRLYLVLDELAAQGYRQFKLVDQESLLVLTDADHYGQLHDWSYRIRTKLERWTGKPSQRYNNRLWLVRQGLSDAAALSGLFGEQLEGEWAGYDHIRERMLRHFSSYYQHTKNKQYVFWVDIHAKY